MIKKWMPQYQGKPIPPDEIGICPKCGGALLSYDEKEDVQKEESKISAGGQGFAVNAGRYIICPQCKNKIMLSAAKIRSRKNAKRKIC